MARAIAPKPSPTARPHGRLGLWLLVSGLFMGMEGGGGLRSVSLVMG
ncbi:hypothetical protein A2U01_0118033, partial [Trifolium medium]|nr:hypothetical protein [Trifolium medium]